MAKRGKFDLKAMEKDILDAAHKHGALGSFHGPHTTASKVLHDKYYEGEEREQ